MSRYYIGADIGGTFIKAAVVDGQGEIVARRSTATPVNEGAAGILAALKKIIAELVYCGYGIGGIGIGTAGRVDPAEGVVLYATENLPGWTGMRLGKLWRRSSRCLCRLATMPMQPLLAKAGAGRLRGWSIM